MTSFYFRGAVCFVAVLYKLEWSSVKLQGQLEEVVGERTKLVISILLTGVRTK